MSAAHKQKRLSVAEKCTILKKLDEGVLANRLAMDFHVSAAAISKIKRKKKTFMVQCPGRVTKSGEKHYTAQNTQI